MAKNSLLIFAVLSPLAMASEPTPGKAYTGFCIPVSSSPAPTQKLNVNDDEVIVTSKKADIIKDALAEFNGDVIIHQQEQTIRADSALFDEQTSQFRAEGNVKLNSSSATVSGESILIDENNRDFELQQATYQLGFNAGRGKASRFAIKDNSELLLTDATFTSCPGDEPSWLMASNEISISQKEGWGEAWNTTFKLGGIPVLWVPYVTFPIVNQRKSGLLFPKFGSTSVYGTYYSQPIYFNLAENYDFTFTPQYMSEKGLLWKGNFRHLSKTSENLLQLEYLNQDKSNKELGSRHLVYWQHESNWSNNWHLTIQASDVGDDNYISEFDSAYHHKTDTQLNNFLSLNYYSDNFDFEFLSQNIQELGPQTASYATPVQLAANWQTDEYANVFKAKFDSQYTLFTHNSFEIDRVKRLHLAPELVFDWYSPAYQLLVSTSYLSTHYQKRNQFTGVEEDIDRGVVKHRVLAGLNFEKETTYFGKSVRQTLEPKIQYVYAQDVDQSNIGLYDSQLLKEDYFSLFRDNTYSGIDRIAAMNQATIGFSTSIFDQSNKELLRFGMAQIVKFENADGTNEPIDNSKAPIAVEWFGQLSENWQIDGGLLYNRENKVMDSAFVSLDYWLAEDKNLQINHRYADNLAGTKINQSGFFASYQVNANWAVAASYHYDLESDNNMDALFGIEYRSCCWSIQVAAKRQVVVDLNQINLNQNAAVEYDNGISINFKISGLGGKLSSSISDLFSNSIFAYRHPYLITK